MNRAQHAALRLSHVSREGDQNAVAELERDTTHDEAVDDAEMDVNGNDFNDNFSLPQTPGMQTGDTTIDSLFDKIPDSAIFLPIDYDSPYPMQINTSQSQTANASARVPATPSDTVTVLSELEPRSNATEMSKIRQTENAMNGHSQVVGAAQEYVVGMPSSDFSQPTLSNAQQRRIDLLGSGYRGGRDVSPTESELDRTGFTFHNAMTEDGMIDRFTDEFEFYDFCLELLKCDSSLNRKEQWRAYQAARQRCSISDKRALGAPEPDDDSDEEDEGEDEDEDDEFRDDTSPAEDHDGEGPGDARPLGKIMGRRVK